MRIGQVSEKYGISVDNLYYYIQYGLLVPPRPKSQYVFDEKTLEDLELVLELKELDFTLNEIHKVLSLYRVSGLADAQDCRELREIFLEKRQACIQKRDRLEAIVERLDRKIQELSQRQKGQKNRIGLPIRMLDLICCPRCSGSLQVSQVDMDLRYLYSGELACGCGYRAKVWEGILLTPNQDQSLYDKPDTSRELYKGLPPALLSLFERSYNWMGERLAKMDLAGRVVMETYVNAWFFMHNHLGWLSPQGRYIVVDKYPETLRMYKNLIEKQGFELDILYIADSSTWLPLKEGCVHLHLDFFAANEHNFYHHSFLYERLRKFLSADARLLGTYFYFENGRKSMENLMAQYPEAYEKNFSRDWFFQSLKESGYVPTDWEDCGFTRDSGANLGFGFHKKGEKMHLLPYLAKREDKSERMFEK